ncbi:hypothetical protein GHT06_016964 [Daphnia sinensis]|uniref:PHD-type domain-containing protein n=1 Tax=Daphnia sinensis TaxID=1820382 RepID=A0AAD5KP87_9CRUS|nr:hypothetical protein GHT06_016964 [Daphnia sinensis]
MNEFQTEVLRQVVGHCSHNIGWNGIHASSLDLLTEVLQKYLSEIGRSVHRYSEQFGRTGPNLDDLGLTFRDMGISIQDLSDYVCNVEPTVFNEDVAAIPVPREQSLNFLKPGSHEVLSRPVHIHEHLPPMQHIVLDDEKASADYSEITETLSGAQDNVEQTMNLSPHPYSFKRPDGAEKRKGGWLGDDGQPIREISSVMMTSSGYLSSSREGKLPETKIRKLFFETEPDHVLPEKKINIKKVFEGIKRTEEISKKSDERDSDLVKKFNEILKDRQVETPEEKKPIPEQSKEEDFEKEAKRERNKEKERVREQEKEKERDAEKETEKEKEKTEKEKSEKEKSEKDKVSGKEQEKDKIKKKRNKEKLLEEFAFFEKGKSMSLKPSEPTTVVDSTKQKLNIFKKIPKSKELDNQTTRILSRTENAEPEKGSAAVVEESPLKGIPETAVLPSSSESFSSGKLKISKKDRKQKSKQDRPPFNSEGGIFVDGQDKTKFGKELGKVEPICSKEEQIGPSDLSILGKSGQNKSKMMASPGIEAPKKKKGRPPRVMTPDLSESQISEAAPPVHVESPIPPAPKSFIPPHLPFPPHFSVPGLIPPPFIPNVPFNLLGVPPLGLRSPLGIPPTNMFSSVGPMTNVPPTDFYTQPKGDTMNRMPPMSSSPTKSPNIVDSLPESSLNMETSEAESIISKKKEKREKKEKEKKKKDKKIKEKMPDEQERKNKKEKKKEKKEKEKDKEKGKEKEENLTVPKITFKFAAAPSSPHPLTPDSTPKLIFKAIADKEGNFTASGSSNRDVTAQSPVQPAVEVAKFSALVTRPPKLVKTVKEIPANKPCVETITDSPSTSQPAPAPRTPSPSPKVRREKPQKPPRVTKDKEKEKKKCDKPGGGDVAVITETVGSYYDEFGNKIWICPACGRQDDGTPMIGCDECDDWYHWVCVGIRVPPAETESWFCQRCIAKKQGSLKDKKKGRKKKSV